MAFCVEHVLKIYGLFFTPYSIAKMNLYCETWIIYFSFIEKFALYLEETLDTFAECCTVQQSKMKVQWFVLKDSKITFTVHFAIVS